MGNVLLPQGGKKKKTTVRATIDLKSSRNKNQGGVCWESGSHSGKLAAQHHTCEGGWDGVERWGGGEGSEGTEGVVKAQSHPSGTCAGCTGGRRRPSCHI